MKQKNKIIYYTPDGDEIYKKSQIHAAETGRLDYYAYSPETGIGFAEKIGKRYSQEDRFSIGALDNFAKLNPSQQLQKIKETISLMQDKHGQSYDGSCLLAVISQPLNQQLARITTVYLGDSCAYLIRIAQNQIASIQRLNKHIHHPVPLHLADENTIHEAERLHQAKIKPEWYGVWRIGGLAVSRAMGDSDLEKYGLIHEAEIDVDEITIDANEQVIIIAGCDGLTESMTENDILAFVKKHQALNNTELANALAKQAIDAGSMDNVSVGIFRLVGQSHSPIATTSKTIIMSVFDGHGGDTTSEALRQHFIVNLEEEN